jgi:hypothetical protein
MDYHNKYQKYKFKYLNLLNQTGAGRFDDLDKSLKELIKNTLDEKHVSGHNDPITFEPILKKDAIVIEGVIYDIKSLLKLLSLDPNPKIPHNRGDFTEEMYLSILSIMLKNNKLSLLKDIVFKKKNPVELLEYIVRQYTDNNKIIDVEIETINYLINNRIVNNNITVYINEILKIKNKKF